MTDTIAPVFVKIEEYKEVLDILDVIKAKIEKAKDTLHAIERLKDEEDRELGAWASNIDDVVEKVENIDRTVFGKR